MPVEIHAARQFSSRVPRARLVRIAKRALRTEQAAAGVTVYVTGNAEIRRLNRSFHATDAPTDVLSFPAPQPPMPQRAKSQAPAYLGDVVISYEQARTQAKAAGWRIVDELELLVAHGVLHLLGFDDLTPRARARMWKRQSEILGHEIRETGSTHPAR